MRPNHPSEKPLIIIFFLLMVISLFGFNHLIELRWEEPRRALVALEMILSDDYLVPHTVGLDYYNKPPIFNWILVAFMKLFNSYDEWVVRMPGVLSLWATAFLTYLFGKKYFEPRTAVVLAAAVLTIVDLLLFETVYSGEIDLFFMLLTVLQALSIFHYSQKQNYWALFLVSYFLAAIGILTKGLPSLAFQGLTLLGYFTATGRFRLLFSIQHMAAFTLMTAMVGGYFWLYSLSGDVDVYLVGLFKDASKKSANESGILAVFQSVGMFPFKVIHLLLPWSIFFPLLLIRKVRDGLMHNELAFFSLIFIASNAIVYMIAPNLRIRYIYMFIPFFLMLIVPAGIGYASRSPKPWITFVAVIGASVALSGATLTALPLYIPELSFAVCAAIGLILFVAGTFAFLGRKSKHSIWLFLIILAVLKFGYNSVVLPALPTLDPHLAYQKNIDRMYDLTGGKGFVKYGPPWPQTVDIAFFGRSIKEKTIDVPGLINYQIPYYYTVRSGSVLEHEPELKADIYYLGYETRLENIRPQIEILHRFKIPENDHVVLFKLK